MIELKVSKDVSFDRWQGACRGFHCEEILKTCFGSSVTKIGTEWKHYRRTMPEQNQSLTFDQRGNLCGRPKKAFSKREFKADIHINWCANSRQIWQACKNAKRKSCVEKTVQNSGIEMSGNKMDYKFRTSHSEWLGNPACYCVLE